MGKLTFGIGHLIKSRDPEHGQPCGTNVTAARALSVFDADATKHVAEVYRLFPDFDSKPDYVQLILGDMMFNMGYARLSQFVNMKACVDAGNYNPCAADEMIDSNWCRQTGRRCDKLVSMMRSASTAHGYTEANINTKDCLRC